MAEASSRWIRCRACAERLRRDDPEPGSAGEWLTQARMHLVDACQALGQRQTLGARELARCGLGYLAAVPDGPLSRDLRDQLARVLQAVEAVWERTRV